MSTNQPQALHETLLKAVPRFRYQGGDIVEWQQKARERLALRLSLEDMPACDPELEVEYERDEADYHEYRFTFQTEPGYRTAAHLLIPWRSVPAPGDDLRAGPFHGHAYLPWTAKIRKGCTHDCR